MFVCVVPLSHPSSKDLLYVKCLCVVSLSQPSNRDRLYVKCLCVVSLSQPSRSDLFYVKCLCVLSRYLSEVVKICYMRNVSVCCLVNPAQY